MGREGGLVSSGWESEFVASKGSRRGRSVCFSSFGGIEGGLVCWLFNPEQDLMIRMNANNECVLNKKQGMSQENGE